MDISKGIVAIILLFMVVGVIDRVLFHNRFGYGAKLEEGIMAMGPLAFAMLGIMCFAPVLGKVLTPLVRPFYQAIGADPAMLAGSLFAMDMGGYPLAAAMTEDVQIRQLSGIYISTMMGATITFSIPVSLGIIEEKDKPYLAQGVLAGFIAIPFGTLVSGLAAGMGPVFIVKNLIPSILLSVILGIGLWKAPKKVMSAFCIFADGVNAVIIICLGIAIIQELGRIVLIPGMDPIGPQIQAVGTIALTLAGAYPLVHFISTVFAKPLASFGKMIGINEQAAAGMVACLANNIPMFAMIKDMDPRGKVIAMAFSVCATFALGDHLGYVSSVDPAYAAPMIAGKLCGGVLAVCIAMFMIRKDPASFN